MSLTIGQYFLMQRRAREMEESGGCRFNTRYPSNVNPGFQSLGGINKMNNMTSGRLAWLLCS